MDEWVAKEDREMALCIACFIYLFCNSIALFHLFPFAFSPEWISHYHSTRPLVSALQLQVDRFMEGFDARTASEKAAARSGVTTDADGWTLVKGSTRSKKRQALQLEEESNRAREQANKKLKKNTVVHFYKHQEREQKKERLLQLREKFEQDKLKIAKMKQERKFKPY